MESVAALDVPVEGLAQGDTGVDHPTHGEIYASFGILYEPSYPSGTGWICGAHYLAGEVIAPIDEQYQADACFAALAVRGTREGNSDCCEASLRPSRPGNVEKRAFRHGWAGPGGRAAVVFYGSRRATAGSIEVGGGAEEDAER
jgi:hypothetical protein